MYAGLVSLEGTIKLRIVAKDNNGTPTNSAALPTWRVYGSGGFYTSGTCSFLHSGSITGATNASPIVITSASHNVQTGSRVTITGVLGNTAANGTFTATRIDANTFSLDSSTGNGAYTSGGTFNQSGEYEASIPATAANGFAAGEGADAFFNFTVSGTAKGEQRSFSVV